MPEVRCGECKEALDETVRQPIEEHSPCPNCGSVKRLYSRFCEGRLDFHPKRRIRGIREAAKKWFVEIVRGADWSTRFQRYMKKLRIIDREKDLYEENVSDPQSGRVVHNTKERLSEHANHGSTKGGNST